MRLCLPPHTRDPTNWQCFDRRTRGEGGRHEREQLPSQSLPAGANCGSPAPFLHTPGTRPSATVAAAPPATGAGPAVPRGPGRGTGPYAPPSAPSSGGAPLTLTPPLGHPLPSPQKPARAGRGAARREPPTQEAAAAGRPAPGPRRRLTFLSAPAMAALRPAPRSATRRRTRGSTAHAQPGVLCHVL